MWSFVWDRWPASCCDALLGALLLLLHGADLLASARKAWVSRFLVPVICMMIDASASTWLGSFEVSRPASDVSPESS